MLRLRVRVRPHPGGFSELDLNLLSLLARSTGDSMESEFEAAAACEVLDRGLLSATDRGTKPEGDDFLACAPPLVFVFTSLED